MRVKYLTGVVLLFFCVFLTPVLAQEAGMETELTAEADEDILNYSFGTVVSAAPGLIVINEFTFEGDEEIEQQMDYVINAETVLDNMESIDAVVPNDEIEIYYVEENGAKVARWVMKVDADEDFDVFNEETLQGIDEAAEDAGVSDTENEMPAESSE